MGRVYETIDEKLQNWIAEQHMFFTSTAPLSSEGLINCSPKGLDSFRILGPTTVAYLDLTGSGAETIAHLKENGRILIMFCAFNGSPFILRLHGRGEALEKGSEGFDELKSHFPDLPGTRAIIRIEVDRISDSCGYGIPKYNFEGDRDTLVRWAEKKGEHGVRKYQEDNNLESLDGLPALE